MPRLPNFALLLGAVLAIALLLTIAVRWLGADPAEPRRVEPVIERVIAAPEQAPIELSAPPAEKTMRADDEVPAPDAAATETPLAERETAVPGFLPYPNSGVGDYERKYAGKTKEELERIARSLNDQLNTEANALFEVRFESGLHETSFTDLSRNGTGGDLLPRDDAPVGSRRWRCQRTEPNGRVTTTWLHERDHPELWAHRDEKDWVTIRWLKTEPAPK